jgi:hypothetical protein
LRRQEKGSHPEAADGAGIVKYDGGALSPNIAPRGARWLTAFEAGQQSRPFFESVDYSADLLAQSRRAHDQPAQELTPLDIRFGKIIESFRSFRAVCRNPRLV